MSLPAARFTRFLAAVESGVRILQLSRLQEKEGERGRGRERERERERERTNKLWAIIACYITHLVQVKMVVSLTLSK